MPWEKKEGELWAQGLAEMTRLHGFDPISWAAWATEAARLATSRLLPMASLQKYSTVIASGLTVSLFAPQFSNLFVMSFDPAQWYKHE